MRCSADGADRREATSDGFWTTLGQSASGSPNILVDAALRPHGARHSDAPASAAAGRPECSAARCSGRLRPLSRRRRFLYAANCLCSNCRASTGSAFEHVRARSSAQLEVVEGAELAARRGDAGPHTRGARSAALLGRPRRRVRRTSRWARSRTSRAPPTGHNFSARGAVLRRSRRPASVGRVLAQTRLDGQRSLSTQSSQRGRARDADAAAVPDQQVREARPSPRAGRASSGRARS